MSTISTLFGRNDALADLIAARRQQASGIGGSTAAALKKSIGDSVTLDKSSKQTLSRLTESVSQYAGDDPKLLRDIVGISNLMQMGAKPEATSAAQGPYAQLLNAYYGSKYPSSKFKIDA